ncbi:MAG: hypothetical protein U0R70_08830 [Solirubrobacteraceae bacterium]
MSRSAVKVQEARDGVARIRGTAPAVAKVLRDLRAEVAKWEADRDHSAEFKAAKVAGARARAQAQIDEIAAGVQAAHEGVHAVLGRREEDRSVEEQLLAEQKLSRAWARVKAQLDAGVPPDAVAQAAAADKDRAAFDALDAELAPYLRAQGRDERAVDGYRELVREHRQAVMSEAELEAARLAGEANDAAYFAEWALNEPKPELAGRGKARHLPVSKAEVIDLDAAEAA